MAAQIEQQHGRTVAQHLDWLYGEYGGAVQVDPIASKAPWFQEPVK
jgi:hypothetical protein